MAVSFNEGRLYVEQFYGALRNLNKLELEEIRNVITSVLSPTIRERVVTLNYQRAAINVGLLLELKETRQFQAISMLARTIFELAVEIKLINLDGGAQAKVDAFNRIEKLRASRQIVAYRLAHPQAEIYHLAQEAFIAANGASIEAEQAALWPGAKKVSHWTKLSLRDRAKQLGHPYEQIYEVHYAHLSWDAHSGVVNVFNAQPDLFLPSVGISYTIAVESYVQILEVVVNEFKLYAANPRIKDKISCAKMLAFTQTQAEGEAVLRAHGLESFTVMNAADNC